MKTVAAVLALVALGGFAVSGASASDPAGQVHVLPGPEARALAIGFQVAGAGTAGFTVKIADLPSCYRFRYVPAGNPQITTIRFAKPQIDAQAQACGDEDAPELVLPSIEAAAIVKTMKAWSAGSLDGAPPIGAISGNSFSVKEQAGGGYVYVTIATPEAPADNCHTPRYAFEVAGGNLARSDQECSR